jgi:hypothetical protein
VSAGEEPGPGLPEVVLVWALVFAAGLAVLVTYARLPVAELYNVSGSGLEGGASRALVFVNYPVALVAVAILAIAADRLRRGWASGLATVAGALCAVVAWPGVVDQADLDAKPANAIPAVGVAIAAVLALVALQRGGLGPPAPRASLDPVRVAVAGILVVAALPWGAAELGFSPELEPFFLTGQPRPEPGHPELVAVHLGHHHGTDGVLLALAALALSRQLGRVRAPLRGPLGFYLALMLVYGLANALEDFWLEQLVKRGATSVKLPSMIRPDLSPAWGAILAAALLIHFAASRVVRFRWIRQGGSR